MKASPKIAHVLPWPTVGGSEVATLRVAQAARGRGFESVAFCVDADSPVATLFREAGFEVAEYEPVEPSYRHGARFLVGSFRFSREIRRRGADLVHCSDILGAFYGAVAGRLAGVPVLCHVRSRYAELSRRDQSFLTPVHRFAFVSHDSWRHFAYRVPQRRGTVIYDGVASEPAPRTGQERVRVGREFGIPDGAAIVGMVARVAPAKDYFTLIDAAAQVISERPETRFLIVGDHSSTEDYRRHYAEVREALESRGLLPYFVFTDFRPDVTRFIRAMDVVVLSTHLEGLPLVILEAMAEGKPVVATAVGGVPEVVTHGETGLLSDHRDAGQLARNVLFLLRDRAALERIGAAGLSAVQDRFSEEQFKDSLERLYRKMLGVPGAGSARHATTGEPVRSPEALV